MIPRARKAAAGLTLIEIVVTLAVLAILATLATPALSERVSRARLVHVAEMLGMDFAEARFQAAESGQTLHLSFRPGADWCYAVARAPGCDCASPQPCQLKVVAAADHPGVSLAAATDGSFDPAASDIVAGRAEWRGMGGRQGLTVAVSPLGRPSVCSPTGLRGYAAC